MTQTSQTYANLREPMKTYVPRKNVMITLNPELIKEAHRLGLSISKIAENALIQTISTLQGCNSQELTTFWRARWDSNPRSPAPEASVFVLTRLRARMNVCSLCDLINSMPATD